MLEMKSSAIAPGENAAMEQSDIQAESEGGCDPCSCGSGLQRLACCGFDLRQAQTELPQGDVDPRVTALDRAYGRRELEAARDAAAAILTEAPGHKGALRVLFETLRVVEAWDAAGVVVDRLAQVHLNDPVARMMAAQHFLSRGDLVRAQFHARMLVRLAPEAVISHMVMGRVFLSQHNGRAAEHHFRVALKMTVPRGPQVPASDIEGQLAVALREQGQHEEARAIFRRLVQNDPGNTELLLAWARLEELARRFTDATALLERAAFIAPGNGQVAIARAALLRRARQPEQALEALDAGGSAVGDGFEGLLQKGQILDSIGQYDEAFEAISAYKAHQRDAGGQSYKAEQAQRLVLELGDFFNSGRSALLPRAAVRKDHPQPIFIVGFPRSGTTLVEQTLSSHPQIAAGDELPIIGHLAERMQHLLGSVFSYPKALSEMWLGDRVGQIESLRDLYLNEAARLGAVDPARRWFTDKMPLNETHLGLISILFPASPVIHLVRHPLDVVLSVFSNSLTHGFHCASTLESAARHYALIADLIAHYREAIPTNYHAVRYEELVAEQEREVRAMFAFIGEPFDMETLAFHENARPARTASYAQVTEPLYARSVARYRNYLRHLDPVIPILMPAIERLGYEIEP
ncbi:MAG: pilus assembly protein [Alphaproteobacteria bacterium HGW-Alphaproteobacteria-16]|nr:MAG: pilus assembly protein [Alphaproteobacteria bacterium HGW-Alphaproteobacteria-16]